MGKLRSTSDFRKWQKQVKAEFDIEGAAIMICGGTGCKAMGTGGLHEAFEREIERLGLGDKVKLKLTGCHGFCEKGPVVVILPEKFFYPGVKPEHVPEILEKTVIGKETIEELQYIDPISGKGIVYEQDVPFYAGQQRNVFRNNGKIDPIDIADYVQHDGYDAFVKVLEEHSPEQVVEAVIDSGLRGRGGGGFPTGVKWDFCRKAEGEEKYIICNADEGDPGAFMDRSILEGTPHTVLEGMLIAGYAIGASCGFIYVRTEYPMAVENTIAALDVIREKGLLGEDILGTGFSFDIEIREGAGAFVCGEETALIASLHGKRGMPRPRPPFPAISGYNESPTNINNVETFANVPLIIQKGSEWFRSIGTEKSKGTKIFALAGKVKNTGLVEVPMGISLRDVVFSIGGGIENDKEFKAAQIGGPSGGCIPAKYLDSTIDYDSVQEIGAIMGSGGLVVMDETTCMVDVAKYFLEFTQAEACGKCTPCRIGTKKMLGILEDIYAGNAEMEDLDKLQELGENIIKGSLCGLGQTAPNPVLSTLKNFREEYETHIRDKRCPAGVCHALLSYVITKKCIGCGACKRVCPVDAITGERKKMHEIDTDVCIKCGQCFEVCKFDAVKR